MEYFCDATYSAEDNKLRLYAAYRLDDETFARVKEAGFKWAPKQELFVAPMWTPAREDLCVELAGEITAEQTTLVERAEAKADRLDDIANRREQQADAFSSAASKISERFAYGQPILVGHHSERTARKDQERMHNEMDRAVKASKAVKYWNTRAQGVERYANMKNCTRTRSNRIKKLLADLRTHQRAINHAHLSVALWEKTLLIQDSEKFREAVEWHAGSDAGYRDAWYDLRDGKIEPLALAEKAIGVWKDATESPNRYRWIEHTLNRLSFEREELGEVGLYSEDMTAAILQTFARTQGAHKPKATKTDAGQWLVASDVPLPAHVADSESIELSANAWAELMQSSGYTVPPKREKKASDRANVPLLNPSPEEAKRLQTYWNSNAGQYQTKLDEMDMTQKQFSYRAGDDYRTIALDEHGCQIRMYGHQSDQKPAVCRIRAYASGLCTRVITISDKPSKRLPITWPAEVTETEGA